MENDAPLWPTDKGPVIGTYQDQEIWEWIVLGGLLFYYDRIVVGEWIDSVQPNEFPLLPGLIYRRAT